MALNYDSQLLESVAVRRRRLRDAVLFGALRGRRTVDERLNKVFVSIVIAAVLCAGCVGWSFISHRLMGKNGPFNSPVQQNQQQPSEGPNTSPGR